MKLRAKFVIYLFLIASIPLAVSMITTLWQSTNQTRGMTLDIVQASLDASAENISGYFQARKAEIATYAQSPLLKTMDFQEIRPFLKSELMRHNGIYEKFILGTTKGHFYNTAGGNPGQGGLRTFNDNDPKAKPKSIAKRDYWKQTIGENLVNKAKIFVSDPMISYTTGAKQIVVAASIKSEDDSLVGMIGGALPWEGFEIRLLDIFSNTIKHQDWDPRFFLVTSNGVYWYHWDPSYIVRLEKDVHGKVKINEIGENKATVKKITDSPINAVAIAGREMITGKRGYTQYNDPDTGQELFMAYAPIKSAGYSLGLVVPKTRMMVHVSNLQKSYMIILFVAILAVIGGGWILSLRVVGPILSLNKLVRTTSEGGAKANLIPYGKDEVAELTRSFNILINSITLREKSLEENKERFALAMQGANDGLWDWDIKKNTIYFSPRWKSMLGYTENELENQFSAWEELLHPDDKQKIQPILQNFIEGKNEKYVVDFRMRHKKGHYVSILSRAFAVRDQRNNAIRLVGTHVDISERRKIETEIKKLNQELEKRVISRTHELEEANQKLKEVKIRQSAILESVVDALITIDDKGIIESTNPATETMFGYSANEMVGNNISMLMPEPYSSEHDNYIKRYIKTHHPKVIGIGREVFGKRKDGSIFPIDLSVNEMTIGDVKKFSGIIRDVSERKQSEDLLRRDSEALKNLNEIAADPNICLEDKLTRLLKLGLNTFDLQLGLISRIDNEKYIVEHIIGPDGAPPTGTEFPFEHTYCAHTYAANGPIAFDNAGQSEIRDHPCYQAFKLESYIGAPIIVDGQRYGTLNFSSFDIHPKPFSSNELSLIQLLAQWIGNELSRSHSEKELGQFKTTLDLTLDCVFMFDPVNLNFFYCNQGALNQIGYSYAELIHMRPYDIKPDISETQFREMIATMVSGEKTAINFETVHQHKNGKRIPVEIFLQYINPYGESPRFVAIVRDITERQQTTQKLNDTLEEMTSRTREITLLSSLGDMLHSCQNLDESYQVITRFMPMLLPQLSGALYVINEKATNFERVGIWGKVPPDALLFPTNDCVAVRRGLSYLSKANESALFCQHLPESTPQVSLCLPLSAQGETFGLLHFQCVDVNKSEYMDNMDVSEFLKQEFAETAAKQVSMALASLRLKEQLLDQSIRDPLTGIFNRRYMEETFERELHRALRHSTKISFIMLDIDFFKKINDTYGHEAGDAVLKKLALILKNMTRSEDIICRYGGEEFVLCLPGADSKIAAERAEEIRKEMSENTFYHDGVKIGQITISLGISVYPENGNEANDLIKEADKALYQAKDNGRNQVIIARTATQNDKLVKKHG